MNVPQLYGVDYVHAIEEHMHGTPFLLQSNPGSGKVKVVHPCNCMSPKRFHHHGPLDGSSHLGMRTILVSIEVKEHSVKH